MNRTAQFYINKLDLTAHPEGGYFKEIYRSEEMVSAVSLPQRYKGDRIFSTSIYFLLEGEQKSSFHRLQSDEIWHFYDGSEIKIYIISPDGSLSEQIIGRELDNGETFQVIIPKLSWFAAEVMDKSSFGLVGCTVAPGFDFKDFELGKQFDLIKFFPRHADLIKRFSK